MLEMAIPDQDTLCDAVAVGVAYPVVVPRGEIYDRALADENTSTYLQSISK